MATYGKAALYRSPTISDSNLEKGDPFASTSEDIIYERSSGYRSEPSRSAGRQNLLGFVTKCSGVSHAEGRGIERVKENERTQQSVFDGFTMWASANLTPATFAAGTLGSTLGLSFGQSAAVIVSMNFFFAGIVGYFGTFGPVTGLRMMTVAHFTFGVWGTRILIALGLCGLIGWASVNCITGAQVLLQISDGRLPLWAGNLIIGASTAVVSFFGYFAVHLFERYCWIPLLAFFIFLLAYGTPHFDPSTPPIVPSSVAGITTFCSIIFGFVAGWCLVVGDYYVHMPANTSRIKLGLTIWAGNFFGIVIPELLGAAFMTTLKEPEFAEAYGDRYIGGLMGQALEPLGGFGKFLLALAALSTIASNLTSNYSLAFAIQNFHPRLIKVPRPIWSIVASIIFIIIAIAGASSFVEVLTSFLSIVSYSTSPFVCCILVDYLYFRQNRYPLDSWDDFSEIPGGVAGVVALCLGFVGAVLSMYQEWYIGVVARASGAELGWIFSGVFSLLAYIPLRFVELRWKRNE